LPEQLVARAPAKVNLALDLFGRRNDGYHELDTIFQELELADDIALEPAVGPGLDFDGPGAEGVPPGDENLALRALFAAAAAAGRDPDFRVLLRKRVPAAAGLGGGSSDAAAVLRLCARAWPGLEPKLPKLALELGSDVPFFLVGGTARGRGRGEQLERLVPLPPHDVVLFLPPEGFRVPERKTAAVFGAVEGLPARAPAVPRVLRAIESGRLSTLDLQGANALEPAVLAVMPWLATHRRSIEELLGVPVALSGAGPTWFWIGQAGAGRDLAQRARSAGLSVILTRTSAP
jgi:4-diphosphocytidyl-2-C-methyl-D-erythritol kinase